MRFDLSTTDSPVEVLNEVKVHPTPTEWGGTLSDLVAVSLLDRVTSRLIYSHLTEVDTVRSHLRLQQKPSTVSHGWVLSRCPERDSYVL